MGITVVTLLGDLIKVSNQNAVGAEIICHEPYRYDMLPNPIRKCLDCIDL